MNSLFYFVGGVLIILLLSLVIISMFFTFFWNIVLFGVFGLPFLGWLEGFALFMLLLIINSLFLSK